LLVWVSDTAGAAVAGTAPTTVAAGTDGAIIATLVTGKVWIMQTETDGDLDIDVTDAGADTWFLNALTVDGKASSSAAITLT
jgi:hypothetical protein